MVKIEHFAQPLCLECSERHQVLNRAPLCCSVGNLALNPNEPGKRGLPPKTSSISLEGGCQFWNPQDGCGIYDDRFLKCRAFPNFRFYFDLLVSSCRYNDCSLVDFLLALWDRQIEARKSARHPDHQINGLPLFDEKELTLLSNLAYWDNDPLTTMGDLLQTAREKLSQQGGQANLTLFYVHQEHGGVLPTRPMSLEEFQQLSTREHYPFLAGLVYPSLESLPSQWPSNP